MKTGCLFFSSCDANAHTLCCANIVVCVVYVVQCTSDLISKSNMFIGSGNECPSALTIAVPSTLSGSTVSEPLTLVSPDCLGEDTTVSAIWYTITPPADTMVTVSSCGSCFDTVLSIYSSSCDTLSCVEFNDDTSGSCESACGFEFLSSSVSFCASGDEYKILLRGYNGATGDYQLNIETGSPCISPENDWCVAAVEIPTQLPQSISFSTEFASGGTDSCNGVVEAGHSVWFKVQGTGTTMIAHTCDPATTYGTAIAVFSGYVMKTIFRIFIYFFAAPAELCNVLLPTGLINFLVPSLDYLT